MIKQRTLKKVFSTVGIGLHSGRKVRLTLRPAPPDTGLVFTRTDLKPPVAIKAEPERVNDTRMATTLDKDGARIATIEHLMSALSGLAIDNCYIDVDAPEIPIMDGSAAAFLELFAEAGIRELPAPRKVMRISRPLELRDGEKYIRALPYAGFRVDCTIDFPHPTIGRERFSMEVTPENFTRVANARTFGFFKDVEYLHSHGLARGGSLESVVVLDDNGVMNPEGLRYKDEFVRHKVLDFIGDMAMLGMPIQGQFEICCSGHQLNNAFLRKAESERALQLIDLSLEEAQNRKTREKRPAYEGSLALA
mgnify:CR=1 FL=1